MLERPYANTETLRLADISSLDIFYTPLDVRFDRLTRLAQRALAAPVTTIGLLNGGRLWFKSVQGWNVHELAVEETLCVRTLVRNEPLIIEDTHRDPEAADHPLVRGPTRFRFYAGVPLRDRGGPAIGTLAIYDQKPRQLSSADVQALRDLGDLAQRELLATELASAQAKLVGKLDIARRSAMIDALTRVWNRGAAEELLAVAAEHANRDDTTLGVIMVDVMRFKQINDNLGHQTGDQVLRRVASILVSSVREGDAVCRYGGDEFLIVLQNTSAEEAMRISERLRQRVAEFPMKVRTGTVSVAITTGTALRRRGMPSGADELVALADQSLIAAKHSAHGRVTSV
jgi:diguanylate cyclase (GGDEF)-like protein